MATVEQDALLRRYKPLNQVIFKTFFVPLGNAPLSRANVICFPEGHTDKVYHKYTVWMINQHYKEGDIILVEGFPAGKTSENSRIEPLLNQKCQIQGWEPADFEKHGFAVFDKHKKMLDRVNGLTQKMYDALPNKVRFAAEDIKYLKELLEKTFYPEYAQLATYYTTNDHPVTDLKQLKILVLEFFQKLENQAFDNDVGAFNDWIKQRGLHLLENELDVAYEKVEVSPEQRKKISVSGTYRNIALCEEINKYRKLGKKVFVIAGLAHLLLEGHCIDLSLTKKVFGIPGIVHLLSNKGTPIDLTHTKKH